MHKYIGPFTIGGNNYLFCESVNGAKASEIIYSIVETSKANGLNVYKYLEFLITELSERKRMTLLITYTISCLGQKLLKRNARFLLKNHNSFFNVQFIKIYLESPLLCGFLLFYALMFECLRLS